MTPPDVHRRDFHRYIRKRDFGPRFIVLEIFVAAAAMAVAPGDDTRTVEAPATAAAAKNVFKNLSEK